MKSITKDKIKYTNSLKIPAWEARRIWMRQTDRAVKNSTRTHRFPAQTAPGFKTGACNLRQSKIKMHVHLITETSSI